MITSTLIAGAGSLAAAVVWWWLARDAGRELRYDAAYVGVVFVVVFGAVHGIKYYFRPKG